MKLSTKGRYGLRAVIDLAVSESDGAVPLTAIAERQKISVTYLEQLFRKLREAGIVSSVRGAGGGYRLSRESGSISVGEVLRALEGDLEAVSCGGTDEEPACDRADLCVTKIVWQRINESIENAVDSITIRELADKSRELQSQGQVENQACGV